MDCSLRYSPKPPLRILLQLSYTEIKIRLKMIPQNILVNFFAAKIFGDWAERIARISEVWVEEQSERGPALKQLLIIGS